VLIDQDALLDGLLTRLRGRQAKAATPDEAKTKDACD
jgi:hypothetical protein